MININPDIIERLPKGCHDCPFSYYDEHNGATFYCGISRWSVSKQRKQKVRHRGCGLIDPDYTEDEQEKEKLRKEHLQKEKTNQDVANEIVEKAKKYAMTLREGNDYDPVIEDDDTYDFPETELDKSDLDGNIHGDAEDQNGCEIIKNTEKDIVGAGQGMVDQDI